jgi:signal transduction histidine kinase/tetratricopeptide (TPR) repeat protein
MPLAQWFRPPRRTLTVFLCLMVVLGSALGWLAWQAIERDRVVERSRVQDRVERAADRIAAALQHSVAEFDRRALAAQDADPGGLPDGAVVMHVTARSLTVRPDSALLFRPAGVASGEPDAAIFAAGEALEFRGNGPAAASDIYRKLTRSPREDVRAGAWVRLGRALRKTGRHEAALAAYDELAQLGAAPALGLPAALAAGEARCSVLEAIGRTDELKQEATLMAAALWSGRYILLRPVWEFHLEEARRWGADGSPTARQRQALALSSAAQWIFERWSAGPLPAGRRALGLEGEPALISWTGSADRLDAALAGGDYIRQIWSQALQGQSAQGGLVDTDRHVAAGSIGGAGPKAVRTPDATGLPWTLHVTSADPAADSAFFAGRRRLLLAGFAVLALVLVAGSYFITRSISRELAVTRLQSEFVSTVSHEFRTPLTSIRQLSEMLARGRVPTEDLRQQSYDILSRESERLQRLVESLLDFGRIEAGAMKYNVERLDGASLVDDIVEGFQETAGAQGFRIDVKRTDAPAFVRADRDALGLAIRNLLDNAVKYSPACRTVWVETLPVDGRLGIRVRDRGVGIPLAEQRSIFDRFVRGSVSRDAGVKGTGIGLTLARHIVTAHHGEIRLESAPGQGSTFTILLPLEDAG